MIATHRTGPARRALHVLEGPAKRGVVGDGGVPGYAIPPSAQVARFPNSGIRHTRGMTDLLKARHGETVPLALHASRPQQLPTNASPHDPRRTYGGDHQQGELMRVATACAIVWLWFARPLNRSQVLGLAFFLVAMMLLCIGTGYGTATA